MNDCGKRMVIGIQGTELSQAETLIRKILPAGIILFKRNIESYEQVSELTKDLYRVYSEEDELPPIICVDQEGGFVARITDTVPVFPSNRAFMVAGDEAAVTRAAFLTGRYLRAAGINLNLAPVLDVNRNRDNPGIGIRSFGSETDTVTRLGRAAVKGYLQSGCLCCAKHFPGKGKADLDAHLNLPVISIPVEEWKKYDLPPFREAVSCGVPFVMSSHFILDSVDPERPVTLSEKIIPRYLREEMSFDGIVITDCLEMDAMQRYFSVEEMVEGVLDSDTDLFLVSHTPELQLRIYELLREETKRTERRAHRHKDSLARVQHLRGNISRPSFVTESRLIEEGFALCRKISSDAIETGYGDGNIPYNLKRFSRVILLHPTSETLTRVEEGENQVAVAKEMLGELGSVPVDAIDFHPMTGESGFDSLIRGRDISSDCLVALSLNAHIYKPQQQLLNSVSELPFGGKVLFALRNPFDSEILTGFDLAVRLNNQSLFSLQSAMEKVLSV